MLGFLQYFNGCEAERNWVGIHRSVSQRAEDVVEIPFFSGVVTLPNTVYKLWKVAMYENYPQEVYEWHT
jgi:hypothetical protein